MKKLKRSECAVLHRGSKHYWYWMIESGVTLVELREASPYWKACVRLRFRNYGKIVVDDAGEC